LRSSGGWRVGRKEDREGMEMVEKRDFQRDGPSGAMAKFTATKRLRRIACDGWVDTKDEMWSK
jgi:hypothetical protein